MDKQKQRRRSRAGFTLIEILLVVTIISLLAGIVAVSIPKYNMKARIAKAKAEHSTMIRDPGREREVLARVEALANSLGISGPLTRKIFSEVIDLLDIQPLGAVGICL